MFIRHWLNAYVGDIVVLKCQLTTEVVYRSVEHEILVSRTFKSYQSTLLMLMQECRTRGKDTVYRLSICQVLRHWIEKRIDSHEAKFGVVMNWVPEDLNILHSKAEYHPLCGKSACIVHFVDVCWKRTVLDHVLDIEQPFIHVRFFWYRSRLEWELS